MKTKTDKKPFYLGIDYYPEHWPEAYVEKDLEAFKDMNANVVRMGEFAWHLMEPSPGAYDFSYFDGVIAKLKAKGLKVIFGTPTATFPAWLAHKHPEILIEDNNGVKKAFGGRRQYCYNSPVYLDYSLKLVEQLIRHYKDEQAIEAWQIDNEFGHEGSDMCYCENCHKAFQQYLKDKYETIETLNDTYGTIFWGMTYNSFEEIPVPKKTITVHNPSMMLDWARFRSYSLVKFAETHIDLVRRLKGEHQLITTNLPGGFFDKWFAHADLCRKLDVVSYDNYPVWGGLPEPMEPAAIAATLDYCRGLKQQNFWIVEELMGAQGHDVIGYLPRPNQPVLWAYQAMAHGCESMLYFRDRGMHKGAEQYCYGVLDHDSKGRRTFQEAKRFYSDIKAHEAVLTAPIQSEVAVLYDFDNIWSFRIQRQSDGYDFTDELLRLYRPFYNRNCKIDIIPVDRVFEGYKVLLVPTLQMVDEALAARLEAFAAAGGTVLMSYRAGTKDKHNNLHQLQAPGYLSNLLGLVVMESESLLAGKRLTLTDSASGTVWRDLIQPTEAEVLYTYKDAFFGHYAAVTANHFGKGHAYYVGTGLDEGTMQVLADKIIGAAGLTNEESALGLELVNRTSGETETVFVMNHNEQAVIWNGREIPAYGALGLSR